MTATIRPTLIDTTSIGTTGDPLDLPRRFDVAVVGGGLAGLVAAATAARAGRSVVLFEQASVPGGRARTRTEGGFSFNIGPHALSRGMEGLRVLRNLGVEPRGVQPGLSGTSLIKKGQLHQLPAGLTSLLTTSLFGWRAKLETARFLGGLGKIDPGPLDGLTLQEWLQQAIRDPDVRQLVEITVRTATYADAPTELSAGASLRQLKVGFSGALYVHGGWQTMVDDLREQAQAFGVQIVSGARVAEIETALPEGLNGSAHHVQRAEAGPIVRAIRLADGRRFEVGAAILAVPPRQASALVDGGRQATLAGWAERAVPIRAATLDVGLSQLPRPKSWFALGLDRALYFSVHSNWARLAPEGHALIHVLRYLGSSPSDPTADQRELEAVLDLMQPGWREHVVTRRFLPEVSVAGALPSVAWEQGEGPRGPAVPDVSGLFVAGDWVGPDGMLADRAIRSGAQAGQAAAVLPALAASEPGAVSVRGAALSSSLTLTGRGAA